MHCRQAYPLSGVVEPSPWRVPQGETPVATFHMGAGALAHLCAFGRLCLARVLRHCGHFSPRSTGRTQGGRRRVARSRRGSPSVPVLVEATRSRASEGMRGACPAEDGGGVTSSWRPGWRTYHATHAMVARILGTPRAACSRRSSHAWLSPSCWARARPGPLAPPPWSGSRGPAPPDQGRPSTFPPAAACWLWEASRARAARAPRGGRPRGRLQRAG
jgi:hypothetical protein